MTFLHRRRSRPATVRRASALVMGGALLLAAGCGGGSFDEAGGGTASQAPADGPVSLTMLIASSGDAETNAVKQAVAAWSEESGNTGTVQVATDITQQLSQGFAGGQPPDLFYVDAGVFADYAANGNLFPYVDQMENADDFYPNLMETFTQDDKRFCAPKDFSTLALQINTASWEAAGLTDADVPTSWDELEAVAKKLTTGSQKGLVLGQGKDRVGAFLVQNGGFWVDQADAEVTADQPKNVEALQYVQKLLKEGVAALPAQVDAGWGGEAFGNKRAAMTMEGNWIRGAMKNDFPDVAYTVHELPAGPDGDGTLSFTQCWGVAASSPNQAAAVDLVNFLTTPEQQIEFAKAFGAMPSRQAAKADFLAASPDDEPFIAGAEYAQGPVSLPGLTPALADLDSQLEQLQNTDPSSILSSFQTNAQSALK